MPGRPTSSSISGTFGLAAPRALIPHERPESAPETARAGANKLSLRSDVLARADAPFARSPSASASSAIVVAFPLIATQPVARTLRSTHRPGQLQPVCATNGTSPEPVLTLLARCRRGGSPSAPGGIVLRGHPGTAALCRSVRSRGGPQVPGRGVRPRATAFE